MVGILYYSDKEPVLICQGPSVPSTPVQKIVKEIHPLEERAQQEAKRFAPMTKEEWDKQQSQVPTLPAICVQVEMLFFGVPPILSALSHHFHFICT